MNASNFGYVKKSRLYRMIALILMVLLMLALSGCSILANITGGPLLSYEVSEPLGDIEAAAFDIYTASGNLTIDSLSAGEMLLASGSLQYLEKFGQPIRTLDMTSGKANLALKWGEGASCTAAIEWLLHLNPAVTSELIARSGGGNITLNLTGMALTSISTDTGGGNVEVVLPGIIANLTLTAKSGAGNVVVTVPNGTAALIHASTGLGKLIIDPRFVQVDEETYQSPDYDTADFKVELTLNSGAGDVEVKCN